MFRATIHTQGPWDPQFQHGGPSSALLVRQLEACSPREDMALARVSVDILAPVPISTLTARAVCFGLAGVWKCSKPCWSMKGGWLCAPPAGECGCPMRVPHGEPELPPVLPEVSAHPTITSLAGGGFFDATEWRTVCENHEHGQGTGGHGSATP